MPIGTTAAIIAGLSAAGASAATGIYGANKQAGAVEDAANIQAKYNEEALADARAQREWQRQQYQDYLNRMEPYRQYGERAAGLLAQRLARGPAIPTAQQVALPASSVGNLAAK